MSHPEANLLDDVLMKKFRARDFRSEEPPSRRQGPIRYPGSELDKHSITFSVQVWENDDYGGLVRRWAAGCPLGDGPWAVLSITANDQTAKHDWRDFQQLKTLILGPEWEAVELYPAESRLVDPSNRFYLWCMPKGVIPFGLGTLEHHAEEGRNVVGPEDPQCVSFQRAFPGE